MRGGERGIEERKREKRIGRKERERRGKEEREEERKERKRRGEGGERRGEEGKRGRMRGRRGSRQRVPEAGTLPVVWLLPWQRSSQGMPLLTREYTVLLQNGTAEQKKKLLQHKANGEDDQMKSIELI